MSDREMPVWRRVGRGVARVARAIGAAARRATPRFDSRRTGRALAPSRTAGTRAADGEAAARRAGRRAMLGTLGALPVLGVASWPERAEAKDKVDAVTGPSRIVINSSDAKEYWRLKKLDLGDPKTVAKQKKMPVGKIGNLAVSRLISGSNLICMNMHARDLDYVRALAAHYNTAERIFMTLKKCEELGVNTIVLKSHNFRRFPLKKYWSEWGGKMQWIADVITADINQYERLLVQHLKLGAAAAYLWGGASDIWHYQKKPGNIVRAFEIMKKYDVPVGIGAHRLEPIQFCEREGLVPDFYIKTLHHDRYWSAHPKQNRRYVEMFPGIGGGNSRNHAEYHDNLFCHDHRETVAFMQHVKVPWIAFKILAAGAIPPKDGFKDAFDGGADFACVGMFDFQIEEDAKITAQAVAKAARRKRPWA